MILTDIVLIVLLLIGAFAGFKRGFVLEVASFLALFLAILGGLHFLHWGISIINEHFELAGKFVPILSFLMIFIGIILLVNVIGKALKKVIHMTPLGAVDTIVGGMIGALKWAFILSVMIWITEMFGFEIPRHLTESSKIYGFIAGVAPAGVALISKIIPISSDLFDELTDMMSFFE